MVLTSAGTMSEVRKEAHEIGIGLKKEIVKGKMKSKWKKEVKDKIWAAHPILGAVQRSAAKNYPYEPARQKNIRFV